jgi:hypothetical protein
MAVFLATKERKTLHTAPCSARTALRGTALGAKMAEPEFFVLFVASSLFLHHVFSKKQHPLLGMML